MAKEFYSVDVMAVKSNQLIFAAILYVCTNQAYVCVCVCV